MEETKIGEQLGISTEGVASTKEKTPSMNSKIPPYPKSVVVMCLSEVHTTKVKAMDEEGKPIPGKFVEKRVIDVDLDGIKHTLWICSTLKWGLASVMKKVDCLTGKSLVLFLNEKEKTNKYGNPYHPVQVQLASSETLARLEKKAKKSEVPA